MMPVRDLQKSDRYYDLSRILCKVAEAESTQTTRLRGICSALNAGSACAQSEEKLSIIMVYQTVYPLHLIERCVEQILLVFNDSSYDIQSGNMSGNDRAICIGARYPTLMKWGVIDTGLNKIDSTKKRFSCVDCMEAILNPDKEVLHFSKNEAILARSLLGGKKIFV